MSHFLGASVPIQQYGRRRSPSPMVKELQEQLSSSSSSPSSSSSSKSRLARSPLSSLPMTAANISPTHPSANTKYSSALSMTMKTRGGGSTRPSSAAASASAPVAASTVAASFASASTHAPVWSSPAPSPSPETMSPSPSVSHLGSVGLGVGPKSLRHSRGGSNDSSQASLRASNANAPCVAARAVVGTGCDEGGSSSYVDNSNRNGHGGNSVSVYARKDAFMQQHDAHAHAHAHVHGQGEGEGEGQVRPESRQQQQQQQQQQQSSGGSSGTGSVYSVSLLGSSSSSSSLASLSSRASVLSEGGRHPGGMGGSGSDQSVYVSGDDDDGLFLSLRQQRQRQRRQRPSPPPASGGDGIAVRSVGGERVLSRYRRHGQEEQDHPGYPGRPAPSSSASPPDDDEEAENEEEGGGQGRQEVEGTRDGEYRYIHVHDTNDDRHRHSHYNSNNHNQNQNQNKDDQNNGLLRYPRRLLPSVSSQNIQVDAFGNMLPPESPEVGQQKQEDEEWGRTVREFRPFLSGSPAAMKLFKHLEHSRYAAYVLKRSARSLELELEQTQKDLMRSEQGNILLQHALTEKTDQLQILSVAASRLQQELDVMSNKAVEQELETVEHKMLLEEAQKSFKIRQAEARKEVFAANARKEELETTVSEVVTMKLKFQQKAEVLETTNRNLSLTLADVKDRLVHRETEFTELDARHVAMTKESSQQYISLYKEKAAVLADLAVVKEVTTSQGDELAELALEVETLRAQLASRDTKIRSMEEELALTQGNLKAMTSQVQAQQSQLEQAQLAVQREQVAREELRVVVEEKDRRNRALGKKILEMDQEARENVQKVKDHYASTQAKNEQLIGSLSQVTRHQQDLLKKVNRLAHERDDIKQTCDKQLREMEKERTSALRDLVELTDKHTKSEAEVTELRAELTGLVDVRTVKQQLERLEKDYALAQKELEETDAFKAEIQDLKLEIKTLQKKRKAKTQ